MKAIQSITAVLILFVGYSSFGQVVIKYDTIKKLYTIDRSTYNEVKDKDFFVLKIENLNTYLYKVEISNTDVDTSEKLPSDLFSFIDITGLSGAVAHLNSISSIVKVLPDDPTPLLSKNSLEETEKVSTIDKLKEIITSHERYTGSVFQTMTKQQNAINNLFIEAQDEQNQLLLTAKPRKENNNSTAKNKAETTSNSSKTILQRFKDIKSTLTGIQNEFLENKSNFEALIVANNKMLGAKGNEDLQSRVKQLTVIYTTLSTTLTATQGLLTAEKYTTLSKGLMELENHKNFEYVSLPIQRYQEINEITINITPRDENARLDSYTTTLRIPDYEKSFWGVSTGIFVAKNLEQNFSVLERLDDTGATVYDLVEEDQSKQEIGFNTMVRYGLNIGGVKFPKWFGQLGFGGGITINEKIRPRILGGIGLAYGEKNKLVLDVGAIYMFYNKLSNVYQLEGNDTQPSDFMVGATKVEGYISLGYIIQLDK